MNKSELMNKIFSYKIHDQVKSELINFVKLAEEQRSLGNRFCDLNKHKIWKKKFPLNEKLDLDDPKNNIIDLTGKDDESVSNEINLPEAPEKTADKVTYNDVTYTIKENLELHKSLKDEVCQALNSFPTENLCDIFDGLAEILNFEQVVNLGSSLSNYRWKNNSVISSYCRYLLLPKILNENSEDALNVVQNLLIKYPNATKNELSRFVLEQKNLSPTFLQYMTNLGDNNCKSTLLNEIILNCATLNAHNMALIESFLSKETELETFNKLIELVATWSSSHKSDKNFGKLLIKIVQDLEGKVTIYEHALKSVIDEHSSIWKSKLQKNFEAYNNHISFTQSIMTQNFV